MELNQANDVIKIEKKRSELNTSVSDFEKVLLFSDAVALEKIISTNPELSNTAQAAILANPNLNAASVKLLMKRSDLPLQTIIAAIKRHPRAAIEGIFFNKTPNGDLIVGAILLGGGWLARKIAKSSHVRLIQESHLELVVAQADYSILELLASNPASSEELLRRLVVSEPTLAIPMACNRSLTESLAVILSGLDIEIALLSLVANPACPSHVFPQLAKHGAKVFCKVLANPRCPLLCFEQGLYHTNARVRAKATRKIFEVRGDFRLSEWMRFTFGFASSQLMHMAHEAYKRQQSPDWMVGAGFLLRLVYPYNKAHVLQILTHAVRHDQTDFFRHIPDMSEADAICLSMLLEHLGHEKTMSLIIQDVESRILTDVCEMLRQLGMKRSFTLLKELNRDQSWTWSSIGAALAIGLKGSINYQPFPYEFHFEGAKSLSGKALPSGLSIIIPENSMDLAHWGRKLNNCLGDPKFAVMSQHGYCLIIGLKHSDEIQYAVEFSPKGDVIEARGKNNAEMPLHLLQELSAIFKEIGISWKQ